MSDIKHPGGAPRTYDRLAVLGRIKDELAKGDRNLHDICQDEGMPHEGVVYVWVSEDTDEGRKLHDIFMRGQELWCIAQRDIMIRICDDESRDVLETTTSFTDSKGNVTEKAERRSDNTAVNRDRLRVMARQWAMAKLAPKHFGDKQSVELTGKDGKDLIPQLNVIVEKKAD